MQVSDSSYDLLAFATSYDGREPEIHDFRPTVAEISQALNIEWVSFERSTEELDFLGALPATFLRAAASSRGALRQQLESVVEPSEGVLSNMSEPGTTPSEIDLEELLFRLDDLPVDPRVRAIVDISSGMSGLTVVPLLRRRSVQYFGAALREMLDPGVVITDDDFWPDHVGFSLAVVGQRFLGVLPFTADASIWVDLPASMEGMLARLRVVGAHHTIFILRPVVLTDAERQAVERINGVLPIIPELIGRTIGERYIEGSNAFAELFLDAFGSGVDSESAEDSWPTTG
ncbi:hypothetical protein ACFFTK_15035 [Pseudonocardia petroleophila]|uniref:Uncharacterized protein n=1 Tax=Pseudonocardia petroleophila TaxID=37331 RepID=A0A7G7MIL2_9PSEU|nr:hypothetical protein [Pseudonocardia petroleophila]QNG52623.1 hypothetical protein H6H00_00580 [Pseudonocardia petroleophila]